METLLVLLLFLLGLALIVKGGDWFVDASSWLAEISGIPRLIVGATVVSLATTLPEILVSCIAAGQGKVDMCAGNAVGSVTVNLGLIMALCMCFMPLGVKRRDYALKSILMLLAGGILLAAGWRGRVGPGSSLALFLCFSLFMASSVMDARGAMGLQRGAGEGGRRRFGPGELVKNGLLFLLGAGSIVLGAELLVDKGSQLAAILGMGERAIALTVVSVGTSLPELVTMLTAIAQKQQELSLGNIIGANIIDLSLILPLAALISGEALPVPPRIAAFDLPACFLMGSLALVPMLQSGRFRRAQGFALLLLYGAYMAATLAMA